MFCEKCGKPLEGEQTLCQQCAALENAETVEAPAAEPVVEAVEAPAAEPVVEAAEAPVAEPVAPEDTFQLASANEAPAKKKKKKGGLIAGIVAAVVVVAAGVGVALGWDSVSAFFNRTFQSPEDYFAEVEGAAIAQYTDEFTAAYGAMLKNSSAAVSAAKGEIALTIGDDILTMVESTLAQSGMQLELDWLKEINLSVDTNMKSDAMRTAMGIALGNNKLLTLDAIMDLAGNKVYLGSPELSKDYLRADISAFQYQQMLAESNKIQANLVKDLPSEEAVNKMLDKYVDIVLSEIDKVEKDSKTVEIDDASQKMTVLTAKIKAKDMLKIAEKALKKAEKDDTLKQLLTAFSDYINATNQLSGNTQTVDLYQQFTNAIPSALESLEQRQETVDSGNYVKLKVYVDMQDNVRGHELVVYTDGKKEDITLSYLTVADGNTVYTEAELSSVEITGEKTVVDGVTDGEYTFSAEGEDIITIKFEDLTDTSGTLLLVPSESFMQGFTSGSGIPASLLAGNVALELSFDGNASQQAVEVNILVGKKVLLGMAVTAKEASSGNITVPTNSFDPANQQELLTWLKGVNFDSVLAAMEKANVPAALTDLAKGYIAKLQYFTEPTSVTFAQYLAMTYEEQVFFQNCFADSDAFAAWYWDAYDAHYYG